jgi:mannose-6-phosphate isomerase-like protein (cupin superfamily)
VISGRIGTELEPNWAKDDPEVAHRSAWPVFGGNGASDSLTYFEIDPGRRIGAHVHDAAETVVLLSGNARAIVAGEERHVAPNDVVHVPAGATHDVVNEGSETLRLLGFFGKAEVVTTFEQVQMPDDTKELGTPED